MKSKLVAVICSISLFSCSIPVQESKQDQDITLEQKDNIYTPKNIALSDIFKEKMLKNGNELFCSEEGYQTCFDISFSQCKELHNQFVEPCFKNAEEKYGEFVLGLNNREIGQYYVSCIIESHLFKNPNKYKEIRSCLSKVNVDYNKTIKTLFK